MREIPFPADLFLVLGDQVFYGLPVFTLFYALAFLAAGRWLQIAARRDPRLSVSVLRDILLLSLVFGYLGARLFMIVELWDRIWTGPASAFDKLYALFCYYQGQADPRFGLDHSVPDSAIGAYAVLAEYEGLVFYGGVLLALIAIQVYFWVRKIQTDSYLAVIAIAGALAYGIGRLGCMFSGDGCFGHACAVHWPPLSVIYGPASGQCLHDPALAGEQPIFCTGGLAVWNTPLIEAGASLATAAWLYRVWFSGRWNGWQMIGIVMIQNAVVRFLIEFVRLNDALWPILPPPGAFVDGSWTELVHPNRLARGISDPERRLFYQYWHWYGFTAGQIFAFLLGAAGMLCYRYKPGE
ncbi:MAG: prolipoprotein diacylglyceryl transferase [Leptospiraceae bacterium]|nr:prolipoprotein diacylglyceryl transferase [Leptospiraceae bacterium]